MVKFNKGNRTQGRTSNKSIRRVSAILLRSFNGISNLVRVPTSNNPVNHKGTRRRQRNIKSSKACYIRSFSRCTSAIIRQSTVLVLALISRQIRRLQRRVTINHVGFRHIRTSVVDAPDNVTRLISGNVSFIGNRHTELNRQTRHINT